MSAAHCLIAYNDVRVLGILVGDQDYHITTDTQFSNLYPVDSFITHEQYSETTRENDIALVRTQYDMTYKRGVGPICLPFTIQNTDIQQVEIPGWGSQVFGGPETSNLRTTTIAVQRIEYCTSSYPYVYYSQLCTYTPGRDACQFDSGGPLIYKTNGRQYSAGIVSYGRQCGTSFPSLNTRTQSYIPWIEQKAGKIFCNPSFY